MKDLRRFLVSFTLIPVLAIMVAFPATSFAQETHEHESAQASEHPTDTTHTEAEHGSEAHGHACHFHDPAQDTVYDATGTAFHHIADANVYNIGSFNFPLPCILFAKGQGWDVFSSKKFDFEFFGHGEGHTAINRYVLDEGAVKRVQDATFPMGEIALEGFLHETTLVEGKNVYNSYACYGGKHYLLEAQSTADGGLFGGGLTSFYDFSISKNVLTMILITLLLSWAFFSIAKAYRNRGGMAPKGLQSFVEPIFIFIG